jgi:hypothetical protein
MRLSPDVKLILSLRDPIERCWSHIRMNSGRGAGLGLPDMERLSVSGNVLEKSDYPTILANWKKFVPSESIFVFFMEDIAEEPLSVLERISGFLGVKFLPKRFAKASLPVHTGESADIPPSVYANLKQRLRPVYDELAKLYPEMAARWASRHY